MEAVAAQETAGRESIPLVPSAPNLALAALMGGSSEIQNGPLEPSAQIAPLLPPAPPPLSAKLEDTHPHSAAEAPALPVAGSRADDLPPEKFSGRGEPTPVQTLPARAGSAVLQAGQAAAGLRSAVRDFLAVSHGIDSLVLVEMSAFGADPLERTPCTEAPLCASAGATTGAFSLNESALHSGRAAGDALRAIAPSPSAKQPFFHGWHSRSDAEEQIGGPAGRDGGATFRDPIHALHSLHSGHHHPRRQYSFPDVTFFLTRRRRRAKYSATAQQEEGNIPMQSSEPSGSQKDSRPPAPALAPAGRHRAFSDGGASRGGGELLALRAAATRLDRALLRARHAMYSADLMDTAIAESVMANQATLVSRFFVFFSLQALAQDIAKAAAGNARDDGGPTAEGRGARASVSSSTHRSSGSDGGGGACTLVEVQASGAAWRGGWWKSQLGNIFGDTYGGLQTCCPDALLGHADLA